MMSLIEVRLLGEKHARTHREAVVKVKDHFFSQCAGTILTINSSVDRMPDADCVGTEQPVGTGGRILPLWGVFLGSAAFFFPVLFHTRFFPQQWEARMSF